MYNEIGTIQYDKYGTLPCAKVLTWWSQSYLVGIEKVICGLKNSYGEVKKIKEFSMHDLPQLSKASN